MKIKAIVRMIALAALLLATSNSQLSTAHAQGTAFTYQGRLNDGVNPANGHYDLQFTLFSVSQSGVPVGPILTNSNVSVTNGLFTTALDFGGIFTGSNYWLEISVRTNGGGGFVTLNPRQPLTPTPYAIFAENVSRGGIAGIYSNAVTLNNAANNFNGSFSGSGSGVSNVNAAALNGLSSSNFWKLGGNAGANPATGNFLGTTDNLPLEFKVNGLRALRIEPTVNDANHSNIVNVIGGSSANFVSNSVVGATIGGGGALRYYGFYDLSSNSVMADFGTVGGGLSNTVSAFVATVGGGLANIASDLYATVSGGGFNTASGFDSVVGGGYDNTAIDESATVGGGQQNVANGFFATVSGGANNTAIGWGATVGGGGNNTATNFDATVSGGDINIATGQDSTVPGGFRNTASGDFSFAAGRQAKANHDGAFVWADSQAADFASTSSNQFLIRAQGGVAIGNNNPQAPLHVSGGGDASLSGGGNIISGLVGGQNLVIDNNEIMSRNNGAASDLVLNAGGGSIGIGRSPTANTLEVAGNASKSVAGSWLANSDARIKTGIQTVTNALDKIAAVRLVRFRYTDNYRGSHPGIEDREYLNVVAQEFQKVFPEDVKRSGEKLANGDDILQVDTYPLTIYSAAAVQELNQKLTEELKRRDAENAELKRELGDLKRLVNSIRTEITPSAAPSANTMPARQEAPSSNIQAPGKHQG